MMIVINITVNQKLTKIVKNEDSGEVSLVDSDTVFIVGESSL